MSLSPVASFTYADLMKIAGSDASSLSHDISINGISTDTRTLFAGNAFIALVGDRFDGHNNVAEAFDKGASIAVIDKVRFPDHASRWEGKPIIACTDPLHMLGSFAWYHRRRFDIPVVAIGGAAGKTSTKELTAHVLSGVMNVLKTEANYNNRIGTPLTLLKLNNQHHAAVVEIGTNEPGEIEILAAMVQPTHGLITNIGKEHLEKLIDIDGVEREETALFDYLKHTDGLLFVNNDDERLRKFGHHGLHGRVITFGVEHPADVHLTLSFDTELRPAVHLVKDTTAFRAQMQTTGLASAYNAACAVSVAWALNMSAADIKRGLESYTPPESHGYSRLTVEAINGLMVLNDTYNANPESMRMSLKSLGLYPSNRRIAVLGDMKELGTAASAEHLSILEEALQYADLVITCGPAFQEAVLHRETPRALIADTHESACRLVVENTHAGSAVLVKGSRSMQMENVVQLLRSRQK